MTINTATASAPVLPVLSIDTVTASGTRQTILTDGRMVTVRRVSAKGAVREESSAILSESAFDGVRDRAAMVALDNGMSEASARKVGTADARATLALLQGGSEARKASIARLMARHVRATIEASAE